MYIHSYHVHAWPTIFEIYFRKLTKKIHILSYSHLWWENASKSSTQIKAVMSPLTHGCMINHHVQCLKSPFLLLNSPFGAFPSHIMGTPLVLEWKIPMKMDDDRGYHRHRKLPYHSISQIHHYEALRVCSRVISGFYHRGKKCVGSTNQSGYFKAHL